MWQLLSFHTFVMHHKMKRLCFGMLYPVLPLSPVLPFFISSTSSLYALYFLFLKKVFPLFDNLLYTYAHLPIQQNYQCNISRGRGNGTVSGVTVCQVGGPGSRPARSTCHRKVKFYYCVIDSFPPVPTTRSK